MEFDQAPEAGKITADPGAQSPNYPALLSGTIRNENGKIVISLTCDYHVRLTTVGSQQTTQIVARSVRDRGKNPNWPEPEPGEIPDNSL